MNFRFIISIISSWIVGFILYFFYGFVVSGMGPFMITLMGLILIAILTINIVLIWKAGTLKLRVILASILFLMIFSSMSMSIRKVNQLEDVQPRRYYWDKN